MLQFLVLKDVFDVLADRSLGLAEQLCELFLIEPDGLIFEAHVELRAAILALVDEDLTLFLILVSFAALRAFIGFPFWPKKMVLGN